MAAADELDLSGLDARAAREYVLAFIRTLKETEQRRRALEGDLRTWTDRAALARSRGREDLAAAADVRATAAGERLDEARAEEARLRDQVAVLKERLKLKLHGEIERSVDSERLEADLEMMVGGEVAGAASEPDKARKQPGD